MFQNVNAPIPYVTLTLTVAYTCQLPVVHSVLCATMPIKNKQHYKAGTLVLGLDHEAGSSGIPGSLDVLYTVQVQ